MKTFTPKLDPAVLDRLRRYAARFASDFPQSKPARWAGVYLHGLLTDGERKSIEPLSRRVTLPEGLTSKDPEQALQQFVSQSTWDEQKVLARYRALMAERFAAPEGVFVFDDTGFPKRGSHSVGVSHQYCGALGKRANCQVAVTLHYSGPRGHFPLALRLHLPESWTADTRRMNAAGVPKALRAHKTKSQIALNCSISHAGARRHRRSRRPAVGSPRRTGRSGNAARAGHRTRSVGSAGLTGGQCQAGRCGAGPLYRIPGPGRMSAVGGDVISGKRIYRKLFS